MPAADYDLRYLRAGVDQLEDYLLSEDVYRPIGVSAPRGKPPYPQLTLGWILLYTRRIGCVNLTPAQRAEADRLSSLLDLLRSRWRTAWESKASREFSIRLVQWGNFLQDYREASEANFDRFAYEVNRRVLLQLLKSEAVVSESELEMLAGLDSILKAYLAPGSFIWESGLADGFRQPVFWYLYGYFPRRRNG